MNGYVAIYAGARIEVWANSLYKAKLEAIRQLQPPKSKRHMVSVMLAEKGGEPVVHTPDF